MDIINMNTKWKHYKEKLLIKFVFWLFIKFLKAEKKTDAKPRLFWGLSPIINFKYWNEALKKAGYPSKTVMLQYYESSQEKDFFDEYTNEIKLPEYRKPFSSLWKLFPDRRDLQLILYIAGNFDIIHTSMEGLIFKFGDFWREELLFYKRCGIKIITLPFGGDFYRLSKIYNKSWQHGLLAHYPQMAQWENKIQNRIEFFTEHANCIICGMQVDQIGRWDVLPYNMARINCEQWKPKMEYSNHDGRNGVVKIYHTPNHRTIKGTEFLIEAVKELKKEGLLVELVLLEKIKNDKVMELLYKDADILVEQLILGYALSAVEGMATGLPVISNLEEEIYTRVFRRYSFLNECPILSSTPERIKDDLRVLVTNPGLRKELGIASREYVEKYHSDKTAIAMFSAVYDKIWYNKPVDLINFYNPHKSDSYNNRTPKIEHPLTENKIPPELMNKLK